MTYPRRLKASKPVVDFPLILQELQKEYSSREIEEITGVSSSTLKKTAAETQPVPKAWHEAIVLLDMYLKVTHKEKIPFI